MRRTGSGFTLIELLVTLAILGLLAALAVPLAEVSVQRAKESELRVNLRTIRNAIDAYKKESDAGRIALRVGASGYPPSLEVLVQGVTDQRDIKGGKLYFLRRIPRDPMRENANSADGEAEQDWALRSYASPPGMPQAGVDVFDIASRNKTISLSGIPYSEW